MNWRQNRLAVIPHQAKGKILTECRIPSKKAMHKRASSTIKTILTMKKPAFLTVGSDSKIVEIWKACAGAFLIYPSSLSSPRR
jgi:hypothetical protein